MMFCSVFCCLCFSRSLIRADRLFVVSFEQFRCSDCIDSVFVLFYFCFLDIYLGFLSYHLSRISELFLRLVLSSIVSRTVLSSAWMEWIRPLVLFQYRVSYSGVWTFLATGNWIIIGHYDLLNLV